MPEIEGEADLVVLGAGLAGHVAALAAADEGLDVVLLEKRAEFGGSSAVAGGGLVFAGTTLQQRADVPDTVERLRQDLGDAGFGRSRPELLDAYVQAQLQTYDWLCSKGAEFTLTGQPVRRLHAMASGALVALLHQRVLDTESIHYQPRTTVESLLRDDRLAVGGVSVSHDGSPGRIATSHGVVLATGGFSRNAALIAQLAPQCADAIPMGGAGSDGDGLLLAATVGASYDGMEYVEASFGASTVGKSEPRLLYPHFDGAVIVNIAGERFVDEALDIKSLGRAVGEQPSGLVFQIFDGAVLARSRQTPKPRNYEAARRDGLLVEAETIPALACKTGLPVDSLLRSVADLGQAPFFAYACKAGLTSTYGGLRVDPQMRVLTELGQPIPGLYAAGELVGGFHGAGYLVGSGLGKAAVFGYVAGRAAAQTELGSSAGLGMATR